MAADDKDTERSHEPTAKKKSESKKKGQVARSKELSSLVIMLGAATMLLITGKHIFKNLTDIMTHCFTFSYQTLFEDKLMVLLLWEAAKAMLWCLMPLFSLLIILSLGAPILVGGWLFSMELIAPKASRINPLAGLQRMFSVKSLIELLKSLLKLGLILGFGLCLAYQLFPEVVSFETENTQVAIYHALSLIGFVVLTLCGALAIIALIDVPYQIWDHHQKLKMSLQEIKDEMKETDVKPEIKNRIRQIQMAMAKKQLLVTVPLADVVITNPTHYAVALRYEHGKSRAPHVVAKGVDLLAENIREIANAHGIEIVSAPPLARAIYFSTKVSQEIPTGLYIAVAKVLAYIYQVKRFKKGVGEKPQPLDEVDIPSELQH